MLASGSERVAPRSLLSRRRRIIAGRWSTVYPAYYLSENRTLGRSFPQQGMTPRVGRRKAAARGGPMRIRERSELAEELRSRYRGRGGWRGTVAELLLPGDRVRAPVRRQGAQGSATGCHCASGSPGLSGTARGSGRRSKSARRPPTTSALSGSSLSCWSWSRSCSAMASSIALLRPVSCSPRPASPLWSATCVSCAAWWWVGA